MMKTVPPVIASNEVGRIVQHVRKDKRRKEERECRDSRFDYLLSMEPWAAAKTALS